ncbi:MAG: hypothetical protein ABR936_00470 [Bacteroidota bacterium]|jgi:hypothetical protein
MYIQNSEPARGVQYAYPQIWAKMLSTMKEENNLMSAEKILHEASTVFQAARKHASELSERGVTDDEFHSMRVLITRVAAHTYTSFGNNSNFSTELRDLKIYKEVIYRTAEMRFGHTSNVLNEFKYAA